MLRRTEAVILKTIPFSEADLIVTALTPDYGLIKTFAKSPRKVKSRFGSSLEPLTYSRISFWGKEDANLPRLTQSDIIRPFQHIRENLDCFFSVAEIIELTLKFSAERDANRDVFNLLIEILEMADDNCMVIKGDARKAKYFMSLLVTLYKIRFLDKMGYGPALDGCARCRRKGYDFYISHGSIICEACARDNDESMRLSPGVIKLYGTMRRWEISKINRIKPSQILMSELSCLLDAHAQFTMAKPLRTKPLRHL